MGMLPDVKTDSNYPFPAITYDTTKEPKFDHKLHLALEDPENVAIMANGEYKTVPQYTCKTNQNGSEFMYSSPFELFTEEGSRVARKILTELKRDAKSNGRSCCLRGIWYSSPWFKDMMLSPEYRNHMSQICGEPVYPHMYLQNTQLNVGKVGAPGPVDQWHFDSVCYVCVSLLSDIDGMIGGELELVKHPKEKAINLIMEGEYTADDLVRVPYKKTGCAIIAQGSRIIHHVTAVKQAKEDRMSLIISLTPANVYHPDNTIFNSMQKLDINYATCIPEYEFFRQKTWHMHKVLEDYAKNEKFVQDPNHYAKKVRAVADELNRVAGLIDGSIEDKIGFFAEKGEGSSWLADNHTKP